MSENALPDGKATGNAKKDDMSKIEWLDIAKKLQMVDVPSQFACVECGELVTGKGDLCEVCNAKRKAKISNWLRAKANSLMRDYCGVSKRHSTASLREDYPSSLVSRNGWDSLNDGFFITGERGLGKTHLAVAMMRNEIEQMRAYEMNKDFHIAISDLPQFVFVPELIQELLESRTPHLVSTKASVATTREIIDKYSNVKLLVLDDLISEGYKGWAEDLFIILDRRYREVLRTIITTNLSLDEIAQKLNDRIASRIASLCKCVIMTGRDRRVPVNCDSKR